MDVTQPLGRGRPNRRYRIWAVSCVSPLAPLPPPFRRQGAALPTEAQRKMPRSLHYGKEHTLSRGAPVTKRGAKDLRTNTIATAGDVMGCKDELGRRSAVSACGPTRGALLACHSHWQVIGMAKWAALIRGRRSSRSLPETWARVYLTLYAPRHTASPLRQLDNRLRSSIPRTRDTVSGRPERALRPTAKAQGELLQDRSWHHATFFPPYRSPGHGDNMMLWSGRTRIRETPLTGRCI